MPNAIGEDTSATKRDIEMPFGEGKAGFKVRFDRGVSEFCKNYIPNKLFNKPMPQESEHLLMREFRKTTFVYGTTGPNSIQSNGSGGSMVTAATIMLRFSHEKRKYIRENPGIPWTENFERALMQDLKRNLYDPGPRIETLYKNGDFQTMDMYYGPHGKIRNYIHLKRSAIIAEFIHYAMGFDQRGPNRLAFDVQEPGWKAYQRAFPNSTEGWNDNNNAGTYYGQSATKEISNIIREGVKKYGGKIIFEGSQVFYDGVFGLQDATRDTDLEAQHLFPHLSGKRSAIVDFGKGVLEFRWRGDVRMPTKAHFLSNWRFSRAHPKSSHTIHNWGLLTAQRLGNAGNLRQITGFLDKVLSSNHELRAMWAGFPDYDPAYAAYSRKGPIAAVLQAMSDQTLAA